MRLFPALFAFSLMATTAVAAGNDVSGLYVGTAKSSDGTATDITLNLICKAGTCRAQFFTSAGDFEGSDAKAASAHVTRTTDRIPRG